MPYGSFVLFLPLFIVNLEEEMFGLSLKNHFEYVLNINELLNKQQNPVVAPK